MIFNGSNLDRVMILILLGIVAWHILKLIKIDCSEF